MLENVKPLKDWMWLQRTQWMRKEKLVEIQSSRLREIVDFAYRKVPFYHKLYKSNGVDINRITDAKSIGKLPIITKQDLRNSALEERTSVDTRPNSCFPKSTSGTTGPPVTLLDDFRSKSYEELLKLRRHWAVGVRPFHKVLKVYPLIGARSTDSSTFGKVLWDSVKRRMLFYPLISNDIHYLIRFLSKWKPDYMVASPFYFRTLIRFSEDVGQPLSLKTAFTRSEVLDYPTRKLINDSLGADVFDGYSARESGPIAWECPTHSGYHINIDSIVLEILHDGEPVSGDETGEVHVTCLWRKATPVIRYRLGDMATSLEDKCPCGRGLPLLKNIQGKNLDMDVSPDGRLIWRGPKKALKRFIKKQELKP